MFPSPGEALSYTHLSVQIILVALQKETLDFSVRWAEGKYIILVEEVGVSLQIKATEIL